MASLTNFNSKSFRPSLLLMERVYLADKPLLLQEKSKSTASQGKKFPFPFDFHSSALRAGLLTAETSGYASEGSVPLPLPPNQLPLFLLLLLLLHLLHHPPHPRHPSSSTSSSSSSSSLPSPRESPSLAPKVLQIMFLNFIAEPGSDCRKKDASPDGGGEGRKLKIPITNHHNHFIISLQHAISLISFPFPC